MRCRTCDPAGRSTAPVAPGLAGPGDRSTVLVLRVWSEGDELRCRLMEAADVASPPVVAGAAQGVDAICDLVRRRLLQL